MNVTFRSNITHLPLCTRKVIAQEAENWDALAILANDIHYEVRELVAQNVATRAADLKILKKDPVPCVREAAAIQLQKRVEGN